jgi:hypothetical protein
MPELARSKSYRLPSLEYTPARFQYRPPPDLVPDTAGASTLKGNAVTMANVADTLAQLPAVLPVGKKRPSGKKSAP